MVKHGGHVFHVRFIPLPQVLIDVAPSNIAAAIFVTLHTFHDQGYH
jgi:hypothetical protein